jgi:DNA-binding CsgD family transcriptional regulator
MDHLEHGRERYACRAWAEAYRSLLSADEAAPLQSADLERLATAAYLTGRDQEFQRIHERLHRVHVEGNEPGPAARSAFWLAFTSLLRGEAGQANAWLARGQRLVRDVGCVERGYVALVVAAQELLSGRSDAALASANEALAIAESFADADLRAEARQAQGRALFLQGDVLSGLKILDEAMLAVVAGELSPIMTGLMYCGVIDACQQVHALGRAREWTAVLSTVCEQQPEMVAFNGACLVHRAEIMRLQGAWPEALIEAGRACERALGTDRKLSGAALYQQGEIHRLCGDFEKAEEAYRSASDQGREPQPGLALLRLAQGRTDAACLAIRRQTSATSDQVRRARLLPAHLEIMLATGDLAEARRASDELRGLAQVFDADALHAVVAQADGAIALAEDHAHAALDPLRRAFELWERLNAPYEAARVRVLIGRACHALGDDEAAGLENEAARSVFERLGARPDLRRLDAPMAPPRSSTNPLTARERHVLRLISSGRTNKQIADELCLSERTVDRHVSNILGKLDVPSRTAATAYAYDHKLF